MNLIRSTASIKRAGHNKEADSLFRFPSNITFKGSNIMFISRTSVSMLWEKEYINCLYIFSPFLSLYFRDNLCRSLKFVIAGLHYPYHMLCRILSNALLFNNSGKLINYLWRYYSKESQQGWGLSPNFLSKYNANPRII